MSPKSNYYGILRLLIMLNHVPLQKIRNVSRKIVVPVGLGPQRTVEPRMKKKVFELRKFFLHIILYTNFKIMYDTCNL